MGFWTSVVAIVAIIAWATTRQARYRSHAGTPLAGADPAYTAQLEREIADLRKRLEVLERIATDGAETRRLAHEIEALRDS
ncbi:hypothetical protein [Novosphingobium huizhouense]|uniref:hypothetical protein n=1 Tax=Novosphingobium huizhouense TaxID=2866625 RepID=UPI001CD85B53|nr:hypothetical protein [Novosphingobium huizhouense]